MAESFLFDVADSLLGKLASYAYEEASRAYGAYEDLQGIKNTLSIVRGVLLDAEEKKDQKQGLHEWLKQIHNICYDAEDILDEFEFQDNRKQAVEASGSTRTKVRHFFSPFNPLVFRFKMAHQIKEIRDRLNKVAADGTGFGLVRMDVEPRLAVQRRELTHSHVDASNVIGRENDKEAIIKLLMESNPRADGDKSLSVIPIVGIGGLGKTTLAKMVFNDKRIDDIFQLKIWVCVSDDFDFRQIIIKIINSSPPPGVAIPNQEDINHFDIEQLQIRLRHKLDGQKYILVLDDIWNDDRAKWIDLLDLIKVGAEESKIIVTTRSNSIASMMGTVPSYVLEGLSQENCLSLFVKWAFKDGEEENYSNLVEIGKEIVKKCAGVPLAIKTLGSSLFLKFDLNKWIFIRDREIWNLEQKKDDILPALKLSYDEMPSYLRQCFAYFSLHPKNHVFSAMETTTLWIALGLVKSTNGSEKLEDIAREYIHELHSRSLLQDFYDIGIDCNFKMHDLIHDLALYVANEEFVMVDSNTRNISEQARHLSIIENDSLDRVLFPKSKSALLITDCQKLNLSLNNERPVRKLMMKFLCIQDIPGLLTLPGWIEGVVETLEILVISELPNFHMLPECLTTMTHVKKLFIFGCPQLLSLPSGMHHLTSLEELRIRGCPELCRKCKPQSGEYWPMIAHIKSLLIEEEED
ncbi:hypothetical protein TSUD_332210 [Trifolium subterraneum]|uniref:Uncharacterized protein n=1 Tax=Trifolium subterraneum TaxID=3900 RepID=A0A2Z6MZ26_TRISU|nr:hypothetical protein TSUD_332210 [Trifolium subterraneum]